MTQTHGMKVQIWTNERKERVDMATIIQAQLKELGIVAEIKVLEWGAYIQGLQKKDHRAKVCLERGVTLVVAARLVLAVVLVIRHFMPG